MVRFVSVALGAVLIAVLSLLAGAATGQGVSPYPPGATGYDISFPQCPSQFPPGGAFGIVGVTNGLPWSVNPCLSQQYAWASGLAAAPSFYMNTANPGPISSHWGLSGPAACADVTSYNDAGCAYNYGWNAAAQAFSAAGSATSAAIAGGHGWWLDVELANSWNGSTAANASAIEGYLDYLNGQGVPLAGVYSTPAQWASITGSATLSAVPNWITGAASAASAPSYCGSTVTGGVVLLSQYASGGFDADYACGGGAATATATASATPSRTATPSSTATATLTAPTNTPTSTATATATATAAPADTDGDGCPDAKELLLSPPTDPDNAWDFYSVPVPPLFLAPDPETDVRDGIVAASDAQAVFAYFKVAAKAGSTEYEQDLDGNGVRDGIQYDRSVVGPGRSGPPDGIVSAADAQLAFAQFKLGYHC